MALSIQMLNNAEEDLRHIEDVSTSTGPTATDRLGNEKMTVAGAVATIAAINNRGAWASATDYALKDLAKDGGVWYFCVEPHISGATFSGDAAYWRVYQGTVPSEVPYTVATYSALRSYAGDAYAVNVSGYIVSTAPSGIAGLFTRDDSDTTSADNGGTIIVASNGKRWKRVIQAGDIDVAWFGADTTGVSDSTTAIRNAVARVDAAGGRLKLKGNFKITIPQGESLISLSGTSGVVIDASEATLDNSGTSYTVDELTPIVLLDGCEDTTIHIGEYIGYTLPTPTSYLGYRGATLVRAINGTKGVKVRAKVTNARYGVQTGEYGDASKGQCSGFDIDIRGSMIGYPFAGYYADDIQLNVDVDGCHRGAYLAGCRAVRGVVRWKDQYIADTVVLITDCLTSGTDAVAQGGGAATTSRGCTDVDLWSIDKGSTVYQTNTSCTGITMSRVDACEFRNIKLRFYTKGTNALSPVVGGFRIVSDANSVWSRYAYDWESTVVLDNIEVGGIVDHSAVTGGGNSGSEFYVLAYDTDPSRAATIRNFRVKDFFFYPSAAHSRLMYFYAPGLANPAEFDGYYTPGVDLTLYTSATIETIFRRSKIDDLDVPSITGGSAVVITDGTVVNTETYSGNITNTFVSDGGKIGGAGAAIRQREEVLSLSGASVSWTGAMQAGEMVLGVQGYVQGLITGATGYQVGVSGDLTRYVNTNTLTQGSSFGPASAAATEITPRIYQGTTDLVVTAKTSNFTGGTLRVVVTYIKFSAPTA